MKFKTVIPDTDPPNYSAVRDFAPFDIVIISLVLVTIKDPREIYDIFQVLKEVVKPGGQLLIGETHPCFQNNKFTTFTIDFDMKYYKYSDTPFKVCVSDAFTPSNSVIFYDYHRPLSFLSKMLIESNFVIKQIHELYDTVFPNSNQEIAQNYNNSVPPFIVFDTFKLK